MASTQLRPTHPIHTHFQFLWMNFLQYIDFKDPETDIDFWSLKTDLLSGGWDLAYEDIMK